MEGNKVVSSSFSLEIMGFITFIVLMILKLTGPLSTVSWFWVTFPLWLPFAIGLGILILVLPVLIILYIRDN